MVGCSCVLFCYHQTSCEHACSGSIEQYDVLNAECLVMRPHSGNELRWLHACTQSH